MEEAEEGGQREGLGTAATTEGGGSGHDGGSKSRRTTLTRGGSCRKKAKDTETEALGGEAGPSLSQYKKMHMRNIYLVDSDSEGIVNVVKAHVQQD